jgi:hypothetical protein
MNFKPILQFFSSHFNFPGTTFRRPVTTFLRPMTLFLRPIDIAQNHEDNCANIVSSITVNGTAPETGEGASRLNPVIIIVFSP